MQESDPIVEAVQITEVREHPNADRLSLAIIKGWQAVIGLNQYSADDLVLYVPPDRVIPREVAARLGVENYLSERTDINGDRVLVVRQVRLRQEPSFGLVLSAAAVDGAVKPGEDVADRLGIVKFEPPARRRSAGDAEAEHPLFGQYTKIANLRHYVDLFAAGERVAVVEKVHGTNSRIGMIEGVELAGSRRLQRRHPGDDSVEANTYWFPWSIPSIRQIAEDFAKTNSAVILYGEVYGPSVQRYGYGLKARDLGYALFDVWVDGRFLDVEGLYELGRVYGAPMAPLVSPLSERADHVLKMVSDDYLLDSRNTSADTTDT